MNNDPNTPPPFVPFAPNFQPPSSSPPLQPEQVPLKETKKQEAAREKREAAAQKKAAAEQVSNKPPKPPRKTRAAKAKRSAKYDLQTILKIAGTLKEADQPVFEKLLGELSALAKGSRERVLKALGEVFG